MDPFIDNFNTPFIPEKTFNLREQYACGGSVQLALKVVYTPFNNCNSK